MNTNYENTVLVWVDDNGILEIVKKVCSSLKLEIYQVNIPEDLIGIPHFFAVIDGKKLNKDSLSYMAQVIKYENQKEFAILLTQNTVCEIPSSIKRYFIPPIEVINYDWIKTNIFNKHFAQLRHKKNKRSYDKTIFRVIYILKNLMKKNSILYVDDLCREFNVSERTIKRDLALLREMGEDIDYDRDKKGYFMASSSLDIEIDSKG